MRDCGSLSLQDGASVAGRYSGDYALIIDRGPAGDYVPPARMADSIGDGRSVVGRSQVVRQRILIPPFGGSNPPAPAKPRRRPPPYINPCMKLRRPSASNGLRRIGRLGGAACAASL